MGLYTRFDCQLRKLAGLFENFPFIRLFRSLSQDECGNSDIPGSRDADAIFLPSLKVKFLEQIYAVDKSTVII